MRSIAYDDPFTPLVGCSDEVVIGGSTRQKSRNRRSQPCRILTVQNMACTRQDVDHRHRSA